VGVGGRLASDDLGLLLAAAEDGAGVALLPAPLVAAPIAAGRLLPVLPGVLGAHAAMSVVTVERTRSAPRVRAFVEHVLAWFAREGGPRPPRVEALG
jgi:DNA-binding transcriptional LysR family regulator